MNLACAVILLAAAARPAPLTTQAVRVLIEPVGAAAHATGLSVSAQKEAHDDVPHERLTAAVSGHKATLRLPAGSWMLSLQGEGIWSPPQKVDIAGPQQGATLDVRMPVWQVGTLAGRLASGTSPAGRLLLSFDQPALGKAAPGPRHSVLCPVDPRARFTCELPQGVHDLQLRLDGFVPKYLWDVRVAAGSTLEVAPLRLSTGASIAGFVGRPASVNGSATVVEGGTGGESPPLESGARIHSGRSAGTTVTLRTLDAAGIIDELEGTAPSPPDPPRSAAGVNPAAPRSLVELGDDATGDARQFSAPVTGRRGFFQLANTPPGEYLIQARLGSLVSAAQQVTVRRNEETWLRAPLALSAPLTLSLMVEPPVAPSGGRWRITLSHRDGPLMTPIAANVAWREDGTWRREGLPRGTYQVGLSDESGNRWALREIELSSADLVHLVVQQRAIRGTVRLGTTPLAARLTFGKGGPVRVELSSDVRGEFSGQLPESDPPVETLRVVVEASTPPLRRTLAVAVPADSSDAVVDLVLPDTTLNVRVVDPFGSPWNEKTVLTAVTDKDGPQQLLVLPSDGAAAVGDPEADVVTFRSLSPGTARVSATSLTAASEEGRVEITEDSPAHASLVMRESLTVKGTVVSSDGSPVAGALLTAMPLQTPLQGMSEERTDGGGRFELRLPRETRALGLAIAAGGFAYRIARVPLRPGEDVQLVLRKSGGGTLRLSLRDALGQNSKILALVHGGHLVNAQYLRQWAELHGAGETEPEVLVVPQMEAGSYALCLLEIDKLLPILAGAGVPDSCASGQLWEAGELSLAAGPPSGAAPR